MAERGDSPTVYTAEQITAILKAADPYMKLVIGLALKCGLREQELVYLEWSDISEHDKVLRVQGKDEYGFAVAGIPCGFAIIKNPRLRARFAEAGGPLLRNTNTFSYAACIGAYGSARGWKRSLLLHLHSNRALVREFAREVGFPISCNEGTYFGWLDCSGVFVKDPAAFFLQEARVAVSKGSHFGASEHIRINYGCERSLLQDALQRMRIALRG